MDSGYSTTSASTASIIDGLGSDKESFRFNLMEEAFQATRYTKVKVNLYISLTSRLQSLDFILFGKHLTIGIYLIRCLYFFSPGFSPSPLSIVWLACFKGKAFFWEQLPWSVCSQIQHRFTLLVTHLHSCFFRVIRCDFGAGTERFTGVHSSLVVVCAA